MQEKPKKTNRDYPLAPTPEPTTPKKEKQVYATGVVISKKDEKAHPEDFKYLKRK